MSTANPRLNTLGRYRIIADLGHGGMGDVYLAIASGPGGFSKLSVLKTLRQELESDSVEAFLDEARLCARLNHPNVVQTYEVFHDGQRHVLVMEYLEGQSMHHVLRRACTGLCPGPSLAMWLRLLIDALEGLHYAHELRDFNGSPLHLVHRDFSPHNVFVTFDGQVKLLDFGIAKAATQSVHTSDGILKGKIRYMAPEQALGRAPIDRRADIFSAGVVLWELLSGQRLWQGQADVQVIQELVAGRIPPPSAIRPVDAYLERVVLRALDPDPARRFATARDMQQALEVHLRTVDEDVSRRQLGAIMVQMFGAERAAMQKTIDQQLRLVVALPTEEYEAAGPESLPPSFRAGDGSASLQPLSEGSNVEAFRPKMLRASGPLAHALIGGALTLVLIFSWLALRPSASTDEPLDGHTASSGPSAKLSVHATAPAAHLFLDDLEVENPLTRELPLGSRHVLRAEAEGYEPKRTELMLRGDTSLEWSLAPQLVASSVAVTVTAPPPAPSTARVGSAPRPHTPKPEHPAPSPQATGSDHPSVASGSDHPSVASGSGHPSVASGSGPAASTRSSTAPMTGHASTEPHPQALDAHGSFASCAKPFFIDDRGIKTLRPECR